jgi:hypothetical protein
LPRSVRSRPGDGEYAHVVELGFGAEGRDQFVAKAAERRAGLPCLQSFGDTGYAFLETPSSCVQPEAGVDRIYRSV